MKVHPESDVQTCVEEPNSTYLVIALYWKGTSQQTFRVHPKLCYRDATTQEIVKTPLTGDKQSVPLNQFSDFLEGLVAFCVVKLSEKYNDSLDPWTLTIKLFAPIDLLCVPLAQWCNQDKESLQRYAVVIGCSDRYDPDQPFRSAELHNNLKRGWKQFQDKASDQSGGKLTDLDWLTSDSAAQEGLVFESYSGFQCYGDWLKQEKQCSENWEKLVVSGIPIALWVCEGDAQKEKVKDLYDRLVSCTRFEFLKRIPRIRHQQKKACKHSIGVFYEDPNYVPEVPKTTTEQFFNWPEKLDP